MQFRKTEKGIVKISITAMSIETFFTSKQAFIKSNTKWQLLKYNRHIQTLDNSQPFWAL